MSCSRQEIVNEAKSYLGVNEANGTHRIIVDEYNSIKPLPRLYHLRYSDPWCAAFVTFVAKRCNALDIIPAECSCGKMVIAANRMGIFNEKDDYRPNIGDIVLYDWQDNGKGDCTGYPDHVGYVTRVTDHNFTVVEGNRSDAVGTRTLGYNARYIRGFILPHYNERETPVATASTIEKIAKLVIRGDYGDGYERVSRLTSAGYDARAVQDMVNRILGKVG